MKPETSLTYLTIQTPQTHPASGEFGSRPLRGDSKGQGMIRLRNANVTASVRLATSNFDRMLLTWDLIVDGLTVSLPAICVLFNPSTIKARTSRSRSVRSRPGGGG